MSQNANLPKSNSEQQFIPFRIKSILIKFNLPKIETHSFDKLRLINKLIINHWLPWPSYRVPAKRGSQLEASSTGSKLTTPRRPINTLTDNPVAYAISRTENEWSAAIHRTNWSSHSLRMQFGMCESATLSDTGLRIMCKKNHHHTATWTNVRKWNAICSKRHWRSYFELFKQAASSGEASS